MPTEEIYAFRHPIYAIEVIGRHALAAAGGGGAGKTGVPNRIEVVEFVDHQESRGKQKPKAKTGASHDTGTEAVMHLSVSRAGEGSFIFCLEGHQCVEYLAHKKLANPEPSTDQLMSNCTDEGPIATDNCVRNRRDRSVSRPIADPPSQVTVEHMSNASAEWELTRLRSYNATSSSSTGSSVGLLNCVCTGGPDEKWLAVGSERGSVVLIDLNEDVKTDHERVGSCLDLKPFLISPDVSSGRSAGVFAVALTSPTSQQASQSELAYLATVCYPPASDMVRIWHVDRDGAFVDPIDAKSKSATIRLHAVASSSDLSPTAPASSEADSKTSNSGRFNFRFKHCQFLHGAYPSSPHQAELNNTDISRILATTVEPLRATRNSVSRLVLWTIPSSNWSSIKQSTGPSESPVSARLLSQIDLPRGHKPACLAVHPSQDRTLLGVGTLEGQVLVFCLPSVRSQLTCVYAMDKAHPAFVTALAFLPPRTLAHQSQLLSYELVSVSIDQSLRWHSGPSYLRVVRLARGLPASGSFTLHRLFCLACTLFGIGVVCFLPVLFLLLDRSLNWLL